MCHSRHAPAPTLGTAVGTRAILPTMAQRISRSVRGKEAIATSVVLVALAFAVVLWEVVHREEFGRTHSSCPPLTGASPSTTDARVVAPDFTRQLAPPNLCRLVHWDIGLPPLHLHGSIAPTAQGVHGHQLDIVSPTPPGHTDASSGTSGSDTHLRLTPIPVPT